MATDNKPQPLGKYQLSKRLGYEGSITQVKGRRGEALLPLVLIALVLALLGSSLGLGVFFWLPRQGPTPTIAIASPIVGQAFFVSSGMLNANGIPSINDELLINLHQLHAP